MQECNICKKIRYDVVVDDRGICRLCINSFKTIGKVGMGYASQADFESKWIESEMILNAVGMALDGDEPSDFELSFPVVRKAWDMHLWQQRAFEVYPNIDIDIG